MSTQELIEQYKNIVVQIATKDGIGTGFILSDYKVIVTNYHVVKGNWAVTIKGNQMPRQMAHVIYTNPKLDLAFILAEVEWIVSDDILPHENLLRDGDTVIAIGHPYGLNYSATQGVVSRVERIRDGVSYVQTDTAINPGNSGGPLINLQGKVIGVNSFILQDADNIGFALTVNYVVNAYMVYAGYKYVGYPTTVCSACNTLVCHEDVEMEKYCPNCGSEVELPDLSASMVEDFEGSNIVKAIVKGLDDIGCSAELSARGPNRWEVEFEKANVNILYKPDSKVVYIETNLGRLPQENIRGLYEYMLRENYRLRYSFFFTVDENIFFSLPIHNMDISSKDFSDALMSFGQFAESFFATMQGHFKCLPPVYEDV